MAIAVPRRAVRGRLPKTLTGPAELVGHSYRGAVITNAASRTNVRALVCVNALAPDGGQAVTPLAGPDRPEVGDAGHRAGSERDSVIALRGTEEWSTERLEGRNPSCTDPQPGYFW